MSNNILKQRLRALLPVIIVAGAVAGAVWFIKTRAKPEKRENLEVAAGVKCVKVVSGRHKVVVEAMGTVIPVESVSIQPEVSGLVCWKNPNLVSGGIVKKGEILFRIDRRNYEVARKQQLAGYEKARVAYQIELSRSDVAAEEWRMMKADGGAQSGGLEKGAAERAKALALREPQLRAAKISVLAASNLLERAVLDLERTEIKAPFNAVIISESVDVGQLVSPQSRPVQLAGTDAFWVKASLPVRELQWIVPPDNSGGGGPAVRVLYDVGLERPVEFKGTLTRVLRNLEKSARMAEVLVRVDDPLLLKTNSAETGLFVGAYVEVLIDGIELDNVVDVPGSLIREGNKMWVMSPASTLEIRDVGIVRRQRGRAMVNSGVSDGELVVSSHISTPLPGMKLRETGGGDQGAEVGGR